MTGAELRALRQALGHDGKPLPQRRLAQWLDVTEQTIRRWELPEDSRWHVPIPRVTAAGICWLLLPHLTAEQRQLLDTIAPTTHQEHRP